MSFAEDCQDMLIRLSQHDTRCSSVRGVGTGALAECDACPKRGFGSLSVAGALAECDASAAGPSRPG